MADISGASAIPVFRVNKRRKVYRSRAGDDDFESAPESPASSLLRQPDGQTAPQPARTEEDVDLPDTSMMEILRRRKLGKPRRAGIEFSDTAHRRASHTQLAAGCAEQELSAVEMAASRFTKQTGQIADTQDKHMMAYIDSKLAELRSGASDQPGDTTGSPNSGAALLAGSASIPQDRQAAGLGKLQEVDLGPSATLRNIERTEAAKKRLETGKPAEMEEQGKPRRWRGRRRRNSEDVRRDQLVEQVLRESRLEIYDEPELTAQVDDNQAADDRLAEQFKQEFLDAIKNNHIRRNVPAQPGAGKGKDERPKGPKLGGSRSARAAMKAMEEAAAKKK